MSPRSTGSLKAPVAFRLKRMSNRPSEFWTIAFSSARRRMLSDMPSKNDGPEDSEAGAEEKSKGS